MKICAVKIIDNVFFNVEGAWFPVSRIRTGFDCQQVPELVVWSSLLPEVTRHMFHVCACPEQPRRWSECPDAMHMGKTLQDGFCDLLLSDLSDRALSRATPR